ncbi:MAG: hypothetical protein NVSMB1_01880 [Polyangiales bacterium]
MHGTKDAKEAFPADFPELKNPPWNAYNHYEIVQTKRLTLTKGDAVKETLPDGSQLEATLLETSPKFKLEVLVKDGHGQQISKGTYKAAKGARFLPVTTPYKGGGLVVSLRLL